MVADADDAWAAAEELGVPVVVKPGRRPRPGGGRRPDHARAGLRGVRGRRREEDDVLVERLCRGSARLLVVGDRVVAAARRDPRMSSATAVRPSRASTPTPDAATT